MTKPTFEHYIKIQKEKVIDRERKKLIKQFKSEHAGEPKLGKKLHDYIFSGEVKRKIKEIVQEDPRYIYLSSPDLKKDEEFLKAYENYLVVRKIEMAKQEQVLLEKERLKQEEKLKKKQKKSSDKTPQQTPNQNTTPSLKQLRKKYHEYEFTEESTERFMPVIDDIFKEYFSSCQSFIKKFSMDNIRKGTMTEERIHEFKETVHAKSVLNEKVIKRAIRHSELVKYNTLERGVSLFIVREVVNTLEEDDETKETIYQKLISSVQPCTQYNYIQDKILEKYTPEVVMNIIKEYSDYKKIVAFMENEILIGDKEREIILKEIPDNVIDLYPNARKLKRHFILHLGPTNSGKTYDALKVCKKAISGIYLAPLRLLAYEIFEEFNMEEIPCNMLTGEEDIQIPSAAHTSSTVEMLNKNQYYDVAVIDECQLVTNIQRGSAWTAAILGIAAREIHLCASLEAEKILVNLIELCGDTYEIIYHERFVPLVAEEEEFHFPESVREHDALIVFSKKSVLKYSEKLRDIGIKASIIYGDLPYQVRQNEVRKFINGETTVVVSTDAIGMGLNLPIQRVVFLEYKKFDGYIRRKIHADEAQQIAGRAGRKGKFDIGYYNAERAYNEIKNKVNHTSGYLTRARLNFPETIISIDMPLSEIIRRWSSIPDSGIFVKIDVDREIHLCYELEKYTDDKRLIYSFITIPFNERSTDLHNFWIALFERHFTSQTIDVSWLNEWWENSGKTLASSEIAYRKCDILFFYYERFGRRNDLSSVSELKTQISQVIMNILNQRIQKDNDSEDNF